MIEGQIGEVKCARTIGLGGLHVSAYWILNGDGGAWNHGARWVGNSSAYGSRVGLREDNWKTG